MLFICQLILTTGLGIIILILWKKNKLREIKYFAHDHIVRKPRIRGLNPRIVFSSKVCVITRFNFKQLVNYQN